MHTNRNRASRIVTGSAGVAARGAWRPLEPLSFLLASDEGDDGLDVVVAQSLDRPHVSEVPVVLKRAVARSAAPGIDLDASLHLRSDGARGCRVIGPHAASPADNAANGMASQNRLGFGVMTRLPSAMPSLPGPR